MASPGHFITRQRLALGLIAAGGLILALSVATAEQPFRDFVGPGALVVLALLMLASSRRCTRCGKGFLRLSYRSSQDLCPRCASDGVPGRTILVALVCLVVSAGVFAVFVGWLLASAGLMRGWAYTIGVFSALAFLAALVCANREARRGWARLIRALPREVHTLDLAAARKASGSEGRVLHLDGIVAWTDAVGDMAEALRQAGRASAREFLLLTGLPGAIGSGLRLLCFETEAAFQAYTVPYEPDLGRAAGWYGGVWCRRIAICREVADRLPSRLEAIVAHEMAHHLLRNVVGRGLPLWLDEGIAVHLAARVGGYLASPDAPLRWVRAALARGELLPGEKLFSLKRRELMGRNNWRNLPDAAFVATVYAQSGLLVAFLRRSNEDALKRLLAGLRLTKDVSAGIRPCFGLTPEEVAQRCLDDLLAMPVSPYQWPPEELAARIERELVVPIRNRGASVDDRRLAIRRMGALGYPLGADALIETLGDPDEALRAEAQRSLEDIAGELHGNDPHAWGQWLDSVPKVASKL